jgi:Ca2+-transporting ATPase
VNDGPAIKGADIGIAMGRSGTEVAREAADMVITDDNFSTIVAAVEEGRGVYANIRKTLEFLLASNSGEVLLVIGSIVIGLPLPLLPVHLLWINLVTDSLPALCLAGDPIESDVMHRRPRPRTEPIATRSFLTSLAVTGGAMAVATLAIFVWLLQTANDVILARTAAFDGLIVAQLLLALGIRSGSVPVWQRSSGGSNGKLLAVIGVSLAVQVACHLFAPVRAILHIAELSLGQWGAVGAVSLLPLVVHEAVKLVRRKGSGR